MKTRLLAVAFFTALVAKPVVAQEVSQDDIDRYCKSIHGLAATMMTKRQEGIDVITAMELADSAPNEKAKEIFRDMIMAAWDEPVYNGAEYQNKTINSFANEAYLSCMKSFR